MARVRDMVEKADTRELSPATQPADLSQTAVMPDGHWRDQAEAREASAPDGSAPAAADRSGDSPQQQSPQSRPEDAQAQAQAASAAAQTAEVDVSAEVAAGVETTSPDGSERAHEVNIGADAGSTTTTAATSEFATAQGSGSPVSLMEQSGAPGNGFAEDPSNIVGDAREMGQSILDNDLAAVPTSLLAEATETVPEALEGALTGVVGQVEGLTSSVTGALDEVALVPESLDVLADTDVTSLLDETTSATMLDALFDPGNDESALDAALGPLAAPDDLLGSDAMDIGELDLPAVDLGDEIIPSGGNPASLLGEDPLDDGLGGLLG